MPRSFKLSAAALCAAFVTSPAFAQGIQEHIPEEACAAGGQVPLELVFEHALQAHEVILLQSERQNLARFGENSVALVRDNPTAEGLEGQALARWRLAFSATAFIINSAEDGAEDSERTHVVVDRSAPASREARVRGFLSLDANWLHVVCAPPETPVAPVSDTPVRQRQVNPAITYLGRIQIARDLEGAQADARSDRSFATLSGRDDRETGEQTASFEGVALLPTISRPFGNAELRPYLGYHRTHSSTSDKEINDLSFGGLLSFYEQTPNASALLPDGHFFDASFDWETDDGFESSVTTAELTYNPIWLGRYGNEFRIQGCLGGECSWDLTFVADFAEVGDPGAKTALLDMDQYGRIGGNLELGYYIRTPVGVISLTGDYRVRDAFTEDGGDADRLVAELALTPSDTGRFKIGLEYVTGEDLTSFEVEDYTALAIGFRN
ncbi:hypothetical protein [Vitreimonas flagellata]|uniref:hypothetical protein n=1 Tax=Vitreimonas flagellata TaxID=2560861 RepID=UPI0010752AF0|nr:hypothetical protein [Vitreimonas flagellata]